MKLEYWNDVEDSFLLNKIFSYKIAIEEIDLFNIELVRDGPSVRFYFDLIDHLPDKPFSKWGKENINYNRCRIGIDCFGIKKLLIDGFETNMKLKISIYQEETSKVIFFNERIKFSIECLNISLIKPVVYLSED